MNTTTYGDPEELPAFDPDDDREGRPLPDAVVELRRSLAGCDAARFCTPEYAGALAGSFENLLDRTVGGGELAERFRSAGATSSRTARSACRNSGRPSAAA